MPLTTEGRRVTGSSATSERAMSSRRRRLTASAVRWNCPSRGEVSASRDWADQSSWSPDRFATAAVVARSATARLARAVGWKASLGKASAPRSAQSRVPGGDVGVRPSRSTA